MNDDVHDHSDILTMTHPISKKHKRMKMEERAAQFSPFAALVGYEDSINEMGRTTTEKKVLSEEKKEEIDKKIKYLLLHPESECILTYFLKDSKKEGGSYNEISTSITKYMEEEKVIVLKDKAKIRIDDIYEIRIPNETETN